MKLGRDIDTCEVGSLSPHSDLLLGLIAQEDALLCGRSISVATRMNSRDSACITTSRIDSKCTIDVTATLVKLDGLPGIFRGLTNTWTSLSNAALVIDLLLSVVGLHVCVMNVPLYLIFAKSERKIEFKCIIVLARVRFLKARLVRICRGSRSALSSATWILRPVVI